MFEECGMRSSECGMEIGGWRGLSGAGREAIVAHEALPIRKLYRNQLGGGAPENSGAPSRSCYLKPTTGTHWLAAPFMPTRRLLRKEKWQAVSNVHRVDP